jgi:hypothetical protein
MNINLEQFKLTSETKILFVQLPENDIPQKHGRESLLHRKLKKWAYLELQKLGDPTPIYEFAFHDLYSPVLNIVVEVGLTHTHKIIEAFEIYPDFKVKEMWLVDFPINGFSKVEILRKRTW